MSKETENAIKVNLKGLNTKFLGRKSYLYEEIDSTQKEIFRRIDENKIDNGCLIMSKIQTQGIGTHGRKWFTDEDNNIAFSFFISIDKKIESVDSLNGLTYEIAKIIQEIFFDKYEIKVDIKLPNDIYLNGKKLGGILTQTKVYSNKIACLVVGIGINTSKLYFDDEIKDIATSIKKELDIEINNELFISEFCNRFEEKILNILRNGEN